MKTFMQRKEDVNRKWYLIDAEDLVLGRLSTKVANLLRGKEKTTYTPHIDGGDFVIVVNASKVRLTGNKLKDKMYYDHSGYPGGLRERNAKEMLERYPEEMLIRSVKGMLPKTRQGRSMAKRLFVYAESDHPHQAQKPETIKLEGGNN